MNLTEEQLAICWVYSNCWKVPPIFRNTWFKKTVDFENTMPKDMSNYDTFGNGVFTVLSQLVSEHWKASEWRRMLAMGDDYWADAERRLYPYHVFAKEPEDQEWTPVGQTDNFEFEMVTSY